MQKGAYGLHIPRIIRCLGDFYASHKKKECLKGDYMEWVLCTDQLPPEDEYVLIYLGFGNYDIAKVELGISEEEREKMKLGELDDSIEYGVCASGFIRTKRSEVYKAADQCFNNTVPYCFRTKSGITIFGQRVEAWCKLPKFNNTFHEGKNAKFVYEDDMEPRKISRR